MGQLIVTITIVIIALGVLSVFIYMAVGGPKARRARPNLLTDEAARILADLYYPSALHSDMNILNEPTRQHIAKWLEKYKKEAI